MSARPGFGGLAVPAKRSKNLIPFWLSVASFPAKHDQNGLRTEHSSIRLRQRSVVCNAEQNGIVSQRFFNDVNTCADSARCLSPPHTALFEDRSVRSLEVDEETPDPQSTKPRRHLHCKNGFISDPKPEFDNGKGVKTIWDAFR